MGKTHEKRVCIKLGNIQQVAAIKREVKQNIEKVKKKIKYEKKKSAKKVKKIVKQQAKKKKVIKKKKKIIKKDLPKKVTPIVKKQEIKKQTTTSIKKQDKEPQKTSTQQTTKKKCTKTTPAKKTTQKASAEQQYIKSHIQEIAQLLQENLYYPRRARKRGIEGEVVVKFRLKRDGKVETIQVITSNSDILSRGAVKTLQNLSGEFPKPNEELILTVPIGYHLSR